MERELRPRFSQATRPPKGLASKSSEEQEAVAERRKADVSALEQEFRPQIWRTLTAALRERHFQILWQLNVARALSEENKVTSRIQLDAEQKVAMGEIMNQYKKDLSRIIEVNIQEPRPREERQDRNEAAESKRDDQLLKLLTEMQRSEWSTLTGKPLDVAALRPRVSLFRSQMDRARKAGSREKLEKKPATDP